MCDVFTFQGSRDNMSIIIIAFPSAPKVDPEAVKQEAEVNSILEKKVTELIESHNNDVELSYVHQFLADEDIPHLPPGGGLASKYEYIYADCCFPHPIILLGKFTLRRFIRSYYLKNSKPQ